MSRGLDSTFMKHLLIVSLLLTLSERVSSADDESKT